VATAYRAAAALLLDRMDEWHPKTPREFLVRLFLDGRYRDLVELWVAAHDGQDGCGRLVVQVTTVDAHAHLVEAVREKAHRWLSGEIAS
jgi:hypothetical protein